MSAIGNGSVQNEQLLLIVLAVQLGFVKPEKILASTSAWMTDPSVPLPKRLEDDGLIGTERRTLLENLVKESIQAHGGDSAKAMASMGGGHLIEETFSGSIIIGPKGAEIPKRHKAVPGKDSEDSNPASHGASQQDSLSEMLEVTPLATGRYKFGQEYARGGQAKVLIVLDKHIGRQIAWKQLLSERTGGSRQTDGSASASGPVMRFLREARITGQLEHPNIVPVYELGQQDDGTFYYTMKLVRGKTLATALSECNSLQDRLQLLSHFLDMCHAIAFAHSRGVIHRDIKPANIMVGEFGETVMLDWGLAKVSGKRDIRGNDLEKQAHMFQNADVGKTIEGSAMGTPSYMSPEQAEGLIDEIDERSDVWGLGAVLYMILAGRPPVTGESPYEIIGKVMRGKIRPISEICPESPPELNAIAQCALNKEKTNRYESVKKMSEDLMAFMSGSRVGAYEYNSWELLKRFAVKNKAAISTASLVLLVLVASLIFISFSYRREATAKTREHVQRLVANQHLAQAYSLEARRLLQNRMPLSAGIFAAASLSYNPANPKTRFYDPAFVKSHRRAVLIKAESDSLLYRIKYRFVEKIEWSEKTGLTQTALDVSHDGKTTAVTSYNGMITLFESFSGAKILEFKAHQDAIWAVRFTPSGNRLLSASKDKTIKVWDIEPPKTLLTFETDSPAFSVCISPDGRKLAAGLSNGSIYVWTMKGKSILHLAAHEAIVRDLNFSPDGSMLASASWDKTAAIWDATSGKKLHVLKGHTDALYSVAFSPDGTRLATSSYDKSVRVWNSSSGKLIRILSGHSDAVQAIAYGPDGKKLACASNDGFVYLWDTQYGRMLSKFKAHGDLVSDLGFSPDGNYITTTSHDKKLKRWTLRKHDGLLRLSHSDWVYGLDFSKDDRFLVTAGWDGTVNLWRADTGRIVWSKKKHKQGLFCSVLTPDGKLIASGGESGEIVLWDTADGKVVHRLKGHTARVMDIKFSPDGLLLASASFDKTIRLWSVTDKNLIATITNNSSRVFGVAFSPDGRYLASACDDDLVRIFDMSDFSLSRKIEGHSDWVSGVCFSPDGKLLASASKDKSIRIWQVGNWKHLATLHGHTLWINNIVFSPDSKFLASASDDEQAILWDIPNSAPKLKLRTDGSAMRVAFSSDGQTLAVTDHNQVVLYPTVFGEEKKKPKTLLLEAEKRAGLTLSGFELKSR